MGLKGSKFLISSMVEIVRRETTRVARGICLVRVENIVLRKKTCRRVDLASVSIQVLVEKGSVLFCPGDFLAYFCSFVL